MRLVLAAILLLAVCCVRCSSEMSGREVLLALDSDLQVQFYIPELYRWINASTMPGPARHLPGVAVLNNEVYICGGKPISDKDEDQDALHTCIKYQPWTNMWQADGQVATMEHARYDFAMAAAGGKLYAVGGNIDRDSGTTLFEVYDPQPNKWTRLHMFLKVPLWKPTMVALRDSLYLVAFNGHTKEPLPNPYQYSTELLSWIELRPLSPVRAGVALIPDELRGLLYAVGGSTHSVHHPLDVVEQYNASHEQSEWLRPNPAGSIHLRDNRTGIPLSGVNVEDRLYVVGGYVPNNYNRNFSGAAEYMQGEDGAAFSSPTSGFWHIPALADGVQVSAVAVRYPEEFIQSFSDREVLLTIDENSQVRFYIPERSRWFTSSVMPGPRRALPGVTVLNNMVYVCGGLTKQGSDDEEVLSDCIKYTASTNEWDDRSVAPLMSARYDFAMATADGKIYSLGGSVSPGNECGCNLFEVYNPDVNRWRRLSLPDNYFPDPLWKPTLAGDGGDHLYMVAFNGRTKAPLATPYRYSTKQDLWIAMQPLSPPRAGVALIVDPVRHLLYVAGGSTHDVTKPVNVVERYDVIGSWGPRKRVQSHGVVLTSNRTGTPMSGVMAEDRLYVLGGSPDPYVNWIHAREVESLSGQDGKTFRAGSNFVHVGAHPTDAQFVAVAVRLGNEFIKKMSDI